MRVTLRHYYDFGPDREVVGEDLIDPDAWDGLRTKTSGAFAIPPTRHEFVRTAESRPEIEARARAIAGWLDDLGATVVASYGVGGAALEWWLHKLRPARQLVMTENGQATLERLGEIFPEVPAHHHDLRRDMPLAADVHLFHRIDTEFSDDEWRGVLRRFSSARILVVAAAVLDARSLLRELVNRPRMKLRGASRAGFIRSGAAFEALWRPTHSAQRLLMHDLYAWALVPMEPAG